VPFRITNLNAAREHLPRQNADLVPLVENHLLSGVRLREQAFGVDCVPQQLGALQAIQESRFGYG
jgi:hypothetical protein